MRADSFQFTSEDGVAVHVHAWLPEQTPRAVLQIAHGMGEHGARYARLAEQATARRLAVYASDHRGHGKSVPAGEAHGHMAEDDSFNRAVADVHTLAQEVARRHPELPRALMGHSMGSFMVQQMLWQHPGDADAFVLSATNGPPPAIASAGRAVARGERLRLGKRGKSAVLDALSFKDFNRKFAPNRTAFDWLSRDDAEVDKYVADPACGFVCSTQTWVDLLDALAPLTQPRNVARIPRSTPIYVFAGTQDAVGDMGRGPSALADIYRSAWLTDVTLKLYPGGRHEMLNEKNRDEVMADLLSWIERALKLS